MLLYILLFCLLGTLIPAIALVILAFAEEGQKGLVIGLLVAAVGFNAAVFSGYNVNHIDLSPNHSGFLMGITNGISNISGILAPLAVQFVVTDEVINKQKHRMNMLLTSMTIYRKMLVSGELCS